MTVYRKPIAVAHPLLESGRLPGITFVAFRSKLTMPTAKSAAHSALSRATISSTNLIPGFATGHRGLREGPAHHAATQPDTSYLAPYMTANVNLSPTPGVDSQPRTVDGPDRDATWLADRGRVTTPHRDRPISPMTIAELVVPVVRGRTPGSPTPPRRTSRPAASLHPHYANLSRDPTTKEFIERIESPQAGHGSGVRPPDTGRAARAQPRRRQRTQRSRRLRRDHPQRCTRRYLPVDDH